MKKILCSMFLAAMFLLGATNCLAAEQDTYLIYRNNDFEDHKIGDLPGAFTYHVYDGNGFYRHEELRIDAYEKTKIVNVARGTDANNLAVELSADTDPEVTNTALLTEYEQWVLGVYNNYLAKKAADATIDENTLYADLEADYKSIPLDAKKVTLSAVRAKTGDHKSIIRALFTNYPMKDKGVISFSFMVKDSTQNKYVKMGRNAVTQRHINYVDNKDPGTGDTRYVSSNWKTFFQISSGKAYYTGNGSVELGTVANDVWYDIDFVVDIPNKTAKVYFNGTAFDVSLPSDVVNIYEVRFNLPTVAGDVWYLDDLRIYEANDIVEDSVLDAVWEGFKESAFYSGYEFESSRATQYDYMAFLKYHGKKFTMVNTARVFDGTEVRNMSGKVYYNDDNILMVPAADLAETFGAEVTRSAADITFTYNGMTVKIVPGSSDYYINGKPAKLLYPVTEDGCMQMDVLGRLLGINYSIHKDLLCFDEPNEFDWHMPTTYTGAEIAGTSSRALEEEIYQRTIRMFLYDRPSDADITGTMKLVHPRIEFTQESVADIKAKMATDSALKAIVDKYITAANKLVAKAKLTDANGNVLYHNNGTAVYDDDVSYGTSDGKRIDFGSAGDVIETLAFAYLMYEDENDDDDAEAAQKQKYKDKILHHLGYLSDPAEFPDWGIQNNSGLGTGTMSYGFAYAYDWVDWTDAEKAKFEEACRRNVLDHALHAYTCDLTYFQHAICFGDGNQNLITNTGILMLAISMYESDPEYYTDVIRGALRGTEGGTLEYFPNGEYIEGISYWRYSETYLPRLLKSLETSMGSEWGIKEIPGILETATFPLRMRGASKAYAFGDAQSENINWPILMYVANQTNDKELAAYRKNATNNTTLVDVSNWVSDTSDAFGIDSFDHDIYHKSNATVIMKKGWNSTDTSVAFHGGANNDGHGHWDIGSFQFDMNGIRFGVDLPREHYNLRDKGHYNMDTAIEMYPDGCSFSGGHYYRIKAEGHNTIVANRQVTNVQDPTSSKSYDVNGKATSKFLDMQFGDAESFAILNMTETNDIYNSAVRGVKLIKTGSSANGIIVQDEVHAKTPTDFLWSMHTGADTITFNNDKQVTLAETITVDGTAVTKKIVLKIISDGDYKFEVLPAKFDETYGTKVKPPLESPNDPAECATAGDNCETHVGYCSDTKYQKLAIRTAKGKDVQDFEIAVAIYPSGRIAPKFVPLELWGK